MLHAEFLSQVKRAFILEFCPVYLLCWEAEQDNFWYQLESVTKLERIV